MLLFVFQNDEHDAEYEHDYVEMKTTMTTNNHSSMHSCHSNCLPGNTTKQEVKAFKKAMGWKENRIATVFFNVFSNENITQR